MSNGSFELRGESSPSTTPAGTVSLRWPTAPGATNTVETELGWSLTPWHGVPSPATDLLRVAGAAYLADNLTPRGTTFTREIALTVAVTAVDRWTDALANDTCDLLYWLTGDRWNLTLVPDDTAADIVAAPEVTDGAPVSLLSGGLDSYLGAIHLLGTEPTTRFIGHKDAARVVRGAQNAVRGWLDRSYSPPPSYECIAFKQTESKRERTSRSRSLLFMSLGTAAAAATGSSVLYIPENGYTSLNVPLHQNRAGALSTRSTHPSTFARLRGILSDLEIGVELNNPFEDMTKGEVMQLIASQGPPAGWLDTSWLTISCSKLDGGRISGGDPNRNCGLCVACLVRRGTYVRAQQPDKTRYLVNEMTGSSRDELIRRRQDDIDAVTYATADPVEDELIDSQTWPDGYDLDAATDLVQRGLDELAAIPLP
jgi:hypothetical protein